MTCKTKKKLKLRKYIKGGALPKFQTGSKLPYLQETTNMFVPQQDFGIKGTNKMSTVDYNTGQVKVTGGNPNASSKTNLGSYMGYVGAAGSAIDAVSDGSITGSETQNIVDQVGSNFAFYSLGKTVDEALFDKNATTGLYKNDTQAALSFGVTDPGQQWSQATDDWNEGQKGQAIIDILAPAMAGLEYQDDQRKEVEAQKKRELELAGQQRLKELNNNNIQYTPMARNGGQLRKFQSGGGIQDPLKPTGYSPIPRTKPQDVDYDIKIYSEYPYNHRPLTGESSINEAIELLKRDRNVIKEDPISAYNEVVKLYPEKYMIGKDSVGQTNLIKKEKVPNSIPHIKLVNTPITRDPNSLNTKPEDLNLMLKKEGGSLNQDKRLVKRPVIRRYNGQTHEEADGGIPVDSNGNPSIMTGNNPVGLTEKNEVAWNGYVFSDFLKRSKKK